MYYVYMIKTEETTMKARIFFEVRRAATVSGADVYVVCWKHPWPSVATGEVGRFATLTEASARVAEEQRKNAEPSGRRVD
jgi:hypothetical protein